MNLSRHPQELSRTDDTVKEWIDAIVYAIDWNYLFGCWYEYGTSKVLPVVTGKYNCMFVEVK